MSDFRKTIKNPTKEDKISLYKDILIAMLNSGTIMSFEEMQKRINIDIGKILSQDETIAIYNLASKLQRYNLVGKTNKKIFEFLKIGIDYDKIDIDNLEAFMDAAIEDINQTKEYFPNKKWQIQISKIFERMEGKDPYKEELKYINYRKANIKKFEKQPGDEN